MCIFDQASRCFEKALSISVAANSLWGISITKSNWAYFVYCQQGSWDSAYETSGEAIALAEESADIFSKAWAYLAYGTSCYGKGLLEEALEYLSKGADCCAKIDAFSANSLTQMNLARIHFVNGKYEASAYCFRQALAYAENIRLYSCYINHLRVALAMAKVMNKDKDVDLELLRNYAYGIKTPVDEAWTSRYMAQIFMNIDSDYMTEAETWIRKAIEADKRNGMMFHLGKGYALYAELFRRKGDKSKDKENLYKAIEIFKECGADGWVKKYEKELATL
jgi:tetratricopeptide (TPR) repeat protein